MLIINSQSVTDDLFVYFAVSQYHKADDGAFGQQSETYIRIFALLTCNRISDAVIVAENAGLFRLAMLMIQASDGEDEIGILLQKQLIQWNDMGALDPACFAPELLDIYRLLGALPLRSTMLNQDQVITFESSVLSTLGWFRAIGMFLWYCRSDYSNDDISPLAGAFMQYDAAVAKGDADRALPSYVYSDLELEAKCVEATNNGSLAIVEDSLYSFFRLLFCNNGNALVDTELESRLQASLRCEGVTRDPLDYRASFLMLTLLDCCGLVRIDPNTQLSEASACIVRRHFVNQLLAAGEWQWALFVVLLIENEFQRNFLAKEIILRYAGDATATTTLQHRRPEALADDDQFVVDFFKIPYEWLHESIGYRFGYSEFNVLAQVQHLQIARELHVCNDLLANVLAPATLLGGGGKASEAQLLELLAAVQTGDASRLQRAPYSQASLLLELLVFKKDLAAFTRGIEAAAASTNISDQLLQLKLRAKDLLFRIAKIYLQRPARAATGSSSVDSFDVAIHDISSYLFDFCSDSAFALTTSNSNNAMDFEGTDRTDDLLIWRYSQILESKKIKYLRNYCEQTVLAQCL
jgi:hypothetical protein